MNALARQLSDQIGIDEATAAKVADYLAQHWDEVAREVEAQASASEMDDRDVPTDAPEETLGRLDDDESWVLRQADSC